MMNSPIACEDSSESLALGMPEPRQVQCRQVSTVREAPPDRFEGQQALGPRAEQEGMITLVFAGD